MKLFIPNRANEIETYSSKDGNLTNVSILFISTYPLKKLRVEHGSANQEHESMRSKNENHGQHFNSGHALKVKLVRLYVKDFLNVLNDGKHQYNLVDSARLLPSGPFDGVRYGLFLSLNVDEMEKSRQHDQH